MVHSSHQAAAHIWIIGSSTNSANCTMRKRS
jgi:hypothetical protein